MYKTPLIFLCTVASWSLPTKAAQVTSVPVDRALPEQMSATLDTPLAGANSFTEQQARDRITSRGFTGISRLSLDSQGIWHGTAVKDGQSKAVIMDYKGSVISY